MFNIFQSYTAQLEQYNMLMLYKALTIL